MFKNEADFEKIISRLNIDDKPNQAHQKKLKSQMLSAFRKSGQWYACRRASFQSIITIVSSPIAKPAAAAAVIIAVLIAIHQFGGSVDLTTQALAEIKQAMQKMPWMHATVKNYHNGNESINQHWWHFASRIAFEMSSDGYIRCWDYGTGQKQYFYSPSEKTVTIDKLKKDAFYDSNCPYSFIDSFVQYMTEKGASIVQYLDKFNGLDVQIYEMEKLGQGETMGIAPKAAKTRYRITVDVKTKLMVAARSEYLDKDDQIITYTKINFDYPQTGPEDIYDLGVPRATKIIDKTKEPMAIPTPGYEPMLTPKDTEPR